MTLSAAFTVGGSGSAVAHETTYGGSVSLALSSITDVHTIAWSVDSTSHSSVVAPTITVAGTPTGATASFTMVSDPGDGEGRSVRIKCLVTNQANVEAVSYRVVGVPNHRGIVPFCVDEELERNATHGWTEDINKVLAISGAVPEVASDTTATAAGTAVYNFPLPTSGQKYLLKFVIEAKEQTDLISYTHVAYVLAWHDGSAAQILGSPSIVINGSNTAAGASNAVEFSVAYTESTTNVRATLTNSSDHTADVNFYCTIEQAWTASP